MNRNLRFQFERGGEISAKLLLEIAEETVRAVLGTLPLSSKCLHTRWCGREIYTPLSSSISVVRENQTSTVNTGDITFWKQWDKKDAPGVLSIFYGAEIVRYHAGFLQVNVFARVPQDQWKAIETIGERIWQQGSERINVSYG